MDCQGDSAKRERRFNSRSYANEVAEGIDLSNRTVLITGTTNGIGTETAKVLAQRGAHIVMANRNMELAEKVRQEILEIAPNAKIDLLKLDLTSLESVKQCADEYLKSNWPLHILILNAGIIGATDAATKDGYSTIFAVNHLAHFYLTLLLMEKLVQSAPARVVVLSSASHRQTVMSTSGTVEEKLASLVLEPSTKAPQIVQYGRSKLCNVLFGFKLHRELNDKGVNVNVVHPGAMIATGIFKPYGVLGKIAQTLTKPFVKNINQGAACSVYCAIHPDLDKVSGRYFESCWDDDSYLAKAFAEDEALQDALWVKSIELIEKAGFTM
ncbi:unnamed protein product [Bursaphelenchus okinawaensis]|uniref:Uncharacterized protein n=1 Tax=Bursaphelenchus okinawaensis TaxID=465554 RepID=A0A811L0T2_9BILA|nr:unnamed protein product [Bursaphelenchus okinawaensis]CAG9115347.1 unnamed protein product [Bursaphelenchus okinawaensis]